MRRWTNSNGPTKDQAFVLLDAMQSAYNAGGAVGATNAGFAVLNRLAAAVGELRFFAGLSLEQVGETLGLCRRTIDRDWRFARAFIKARME